jgi:hypothetical protein
LDWIDFGLVWLGVVARTSKCGFKGRLSIRMRSTCRISELGWVEAQPNSQTRTDRMPHWYAHNITFHQSNEAGMWGYCVKHKPKTECMLVLFRAQPSSTEKDSAWTAFNFSERSRVGSLDKRIGYKIERGIFFKKFQCGATTISVFLSYRKSASERSRKKSPLNFVGGIVSFPKCSNLSKSVEACRCWINCYPSLKFSAIESWPYFWKSKCTTQQVFRSTTIQSIKFKVSCATIRSWRKFIFWRFLLNVSA